MTDARSNQDLNDYWGRTGLAPAILAALVAAGKRLDALTIDDLAPFDQFHGGGKAATVRLARLAGLVPGTRVLDVGGGLGGPARTLAVEFGCQVTVLDVTESYVQAGTLLTTHLGLNDRVTHRLGTALALPDDLGAVDVVWTQNSGMNIADKAQLYAGFHRVLQPGGRLAFHEPMAGPVQPLIFPTMWAADGASSFLWPPDELRQLIEAAGFRAQTWEVTGYPAPVPGAGGAGPTIADLVMGEAIAGIDAANARNRTEDRLVLVYAVFDRP